jgi:hypothetical protein
MRIESDKVIRGFKELANYLQISTETARKLMNKPEFPVVVVTPHVRYISIDALEQWLLSNRKPLD